MKGDHGEPHVPRLGLSVYFKEDGQSRMTPSRLLRLCGSAIFLLEKSEAGLSEWL